MSIIWQETEIPTKLINGHSELSCRLLKKSCGETSREGETRNPEDIRLLVLFTPNSELIYTLDEIFDPRGKRLERVIAILPAGGNSTIVKTVKNNFEIFRN